VSWKVTSKDIKRTSEPIRQLRPAVGGTQYFFYLRTDMARALLKMQRRQVAKGQSIRWKRDLRHLAAEEVSTTTLQEQRQYRARSQAHEIRSALESFLFWLSFIFFRVIRIVSAAALEAFHEEVDIGRSVRLSSTLPRGATAGQNRRTYRDPAVVEDGDSVLSQED